MIYRTLLKINEQAKDALWDILMAKEDGEYRIPFLDGLATLLFAGWLTDSAYYFSEFISTYLI